MDKKMNDICELKNHLISFAQQHQECDPASIPVYGEVIDMIKDLYEAEEKCWKACYYKEVVEAMKKEKECYPEMINMRSGYDNWRFRSGEFAPKGHGHYAGFRPMMPDDMKYGMYPEWMTGAYGYSTNRSSMGNRGGNNQTGNPDQRGSNRYGYPMDEYWAGMRSPYDMYQESRRHYHESKSPEDRKEMEQHAKEHVEETMDSLRDIWEESTPELRKEMKKNLSGLINALPA